MGDVIKMNSTGEVALVNVENTLLEVTQGLLQDAHSTLDNRIIMSVPIAELATLGAGVSSLIPALNTVTTTTTLATDGLFRVTNQAAEDVLKMAKNGNAWGAMKTATVALRWCS